VPESQATRGIASRWKKQELRDGRIEINCNWRNRKEEIEIWYDDRIGDREECGGPQSRVACEDSAASGERESGQA